MLFTEATSTVGDPYGEARVLRTLTLAPDGAGGWLLSPRDVYVHGEVYATAKDGSTYVTARSCGLDRSAQAACQPHLTPFWAAARVRPGARATLGAAGHPETGSSSACCCPTAPSSRRPARRPARSPRSTTPRPFLLRRVPDAVLRPRRRARGRAVATRRRAHGRGRGPARRDPAPAGRHARPAPRRRPGLEAQPGGGLAREGPVGGRARLARRARRERVRRRARRRSAAAAAASAAARACWTAPRSSARPGIASSSAGRRPGPKGDEAADLARLLALRARDEITRLPQGRPGAVRRVGPRAGPARAARGRPGARLGVPERPGRAAALADRPAPGRRRHGGRDRPLDVLGARPGARRGPRRPAGRGGRHPEGGARRDGRARRGGRGRRERRPRRDRGAGAAEEWWRDGGAAWTHLGVLTAGRGVIHSLRTLAHEYAHFANERLDYADLERIGVDREAETQRWVDLDGLLALSVLEEAQAEATATCAVLACFDASAQREVIRWYDGQDTRPTAEPDFRRRLYALAYGPSPAVLGPHCDLDDDLEAVLAKAWAAWPYRTQALLFPRDAVSPSRLWERARSLADEGAVDGTRVGAFTLLFHLDRRGDATARGEPGPRPRPRGRRPPPVRGRRPAVGDRVARRGRPPGASSNASRTSPGLLIRQRGRHVTVCTGGVPRQRAWLGHLLPAEAASPREADRAGAGRNRPAGRPGERSADRRVGTPVAGAARRRYPCRSRAGGAAMSRRPAPRSSDCSSPCCSWCPRGPRPPSRSPRSTRATSPSPPLPQQQLLVATGTFGLRGGSETRLVRTIRLDAGADGAWSDPAAGRLGARQGGGDRGVGGRGGHAHHVAVGGLSCSAARAPCRPRPPAPLLYQWSASELGARDVVVGPPTAEGGVRPPAGGAEGTAWTEAEAPVYHALFAPADLDMLPVLAAVSGKWVKEQERKAERSVRRPEGLTPYTHRTTVHYLGVTKERALFEFEVLTTGNVLPDDHAWTLERRAVGSVLVDAGGPPLPRARGGHGDGSDADGREVHVVVSAVDLKPLEGEAPAAGAAARFGAALALRAADPTAFRAALLAACAATARQRSPRSATPTASTA